VGDAGKGGIVVLPLLILVVTGGFEQREGIRIDVHRIGAVHRDVSARNIGEKIVKDFGVGTLLFGGEFKYFGDDGKVVLFCLTCGKGVAVSRLTFSGEGPHEVLPCQAFGEVYIPFGDVVIIVDQVYTPFKTDIHSMPREDSG